jgi:hypothetical protein
MGMRLIAGRYSIAKAIFRLAKTFGVNGIVERTAAKAASTK